MCNCWSFWTCWLLYNLFLWASGFLNAQIRLVSHSAATLKVLPLKHVHSFVRFYFFLFTTKQADSSNECLVIPWSTENTSSDPFSLVIMVLYQCETSVCAVIWKTLQLLPSSSVIASSVQYCRPTDQIHIHTHKLLNRQSGYNWETCMLAHI